MICVEFHHTSGWVSTFEADHVEEAFTLLIEHVTKCTPGYTSLQFMGRYVIPAKAVAGIMLPEEKYPTRKWIIPAVYLQQCTVSISTIHNEAN